mmetsp:Transcript_24066/g.46958  ORF Transcript_24066/g.46958 Transcript_24066/m.46958 type:complete len:249 (+) Transcript_24066:389-1135(+)
MNQLVHTMSSIEFQSRLYLLCCVHAVEVGVELVSFDKLSVYLNSPTTVPLAYRWGCDFALSMSSFLHVLMQHFQEPCRVVHDLFRLLPQNLVHPLTDHVFFPEVLACIRSPPVHPCIFKGVWKVLRRDERATFELVLRRMDRGERVSVQKFFPIASEFDVINNHPSSIIDLDARSVLVLINGNSHALVEHKLAIVRVVRLVSGSVEEVQLRHCFQFRKFSIHDVVVVLEDTVTKLSDQFVVCCSFLRK